MRPKDNMVHTSLRKCLETVWRAELINEPLGPFRLLHNTLLVILADGPRQFIIVHCRSVLTFAPESRYTNRIFNFEDTLGSVDPSDTASVEVWLWQELFQELPQVDVRSARLLACLPDGFGGCQVHTFSVFTSYVICRTKQMENQVTGEWKLFSW